MRTVAAVLVTSMLLAGCGPEPSAPASAPTVTPSATPDPNGWAFAIGKNSVELAWMTESAPNTSPLRLVCARGVGIMVEAATLKPIASEERLSIGVGDEPIALAAVVAATAHGTVIRATGPADETFLAALAAGGPVVVSYGVQHYGPLASPGEAVRRAFTETCRKLNAGKPV
jgi:hypothetical protein